MAVSFPLLVPAFPHFPSSLLLIQVRHTHLQREAKGCQVLFLPAYSPDFSPIEETFSKIKAYLRRVGARGREALQEAICQALLTVTAQDAQGWFRHCGYLPADSRA